MLAKEDKDNYKKDKEKKSGSNAVHSSVASPE